MEELAEEFINIWNKNFNILSVNEYEFDKYVNVINKLRKKCKLEIEDKKVFIDLVEYMADSFYIVNCADKYENKYKENENYYRQSEKYEESELNCCSNILNHLQSEILWNLENDFQNALDMEMSKNVGNCLQK